MVKWRSPPKCAYLAHNRTRFCCEPKFFSFVDTLKRFPNSITKNGGLDMKKPYLFIITVYYVSVFCLGIGAQSPAKPPFDDPRVERLKGAVFQLCDAAINYAAKGQYDRAIALFSKALEINPRYAEAYNNRGIAYAKGKGQYEKALSDFLKAIEINPVNADIYDNRGITYERLGDKEKACSDWKKACQLGSCKAYEAAKRKDDC